MAASENFVSLPLTRSNEVKGPNGEAQPDDRGIKSIRDQAFGPQDVARKTSAADKILPPGNLVLELGPQSSASTKNLNPNVDIAPVNSKADVKSVIPSPLDNQVHASGTEASDSLVDHSSYSVADMTFREKYVLEGVQDTLTGAKKRLDEAVHDWPLTAVEVVSGVAIGSALVLASRNPALATPMRILNKTMLGIAAVDLVSRVAIPSYDALTHPSHLETDRKDVGDRLGAAVVDYSMAALSGGVGSRAVTPLIERTQVGSMISGYDFFKTPAGAEVRVFKSGNALITKNGIRVFRPADMDFDHLDPLAEPKRGIVGNNDLLRETFAKAENNPQGWRQGRDIVESAGKFATWFETVTGALATELVERSVDVGIGLIEHNYLVKTLASPEEQAAPGPKHDVQPDEVTVKPPAK